MKTKHTPGIWEAYNIPDTNRTIIQVKGDYYKGIVPIAEIGPYNSKELQKSNAQLMAAAPEMLEALMAANAVFVALGIDSLNRIVGEQVKQVRAAIKKAIE